jgi:hypothetical protein
MKDDIETIAARMRSEELAVNEHLAHSIDVRHVSPSLLDGQIEGALSRR